MPGFLTMIFVLVRVVAIAAAVTLLLPAVFVGAGFLLSLILPLGLFECSLLSLGSALLTALVFFATAVAPWALRSGAFDEDDLDYAFLEDDEELDDPKETGGEPLEFASPSSSPRVGRNAPCPCGSGKKFKHCCGRP